MKHLSRTILYLMFALIILLISAGAYWYIYTSVNKEIVATLNALVAVQKEKNVTAREKNLDIMLHSTEAERARIASIFVPEGAVVSFIERFEGLGKDSGADVSISSISSEDLSAAAKGTIGKITAHVTGAGSWNSVMKTLMLAENLPYSITINNLTLDHIGTDTRSASKWRVDFDVEVLSIK